MNCLNSYIVNLHFPGRTVGWKSDICKQDLSDWCPCTRTRVKHSGLRTLHSFMKHLTTNRAVFSLFKLHSRAFLNVSEEFRRMVGLGTIAVCHLSSSNIIHFGH
jgi:hypothetical protein